MAYPLIQKKRKFRDILLLIVDKIRIKKDTNYSRNLIIPSPYKQIFSNKNHTESHPKKSQKENAVSNLTVQQFLEMLQEQNITGLGGGGFPAAQKIKTFLASKSPTKRVLINGVECDPGLVHDAHILKEHHHEIEQGLEVLRTLFQPQEMVLALTNQAGFWKNAHAMQIPHHYPSGQEHRLIETVFQIPIPTSEPPAHHGILVLNVQTLLQIYETVASSEYKSHRFVTVGNLETGMAQVLRVAPGTTSQEAVDQAFPGQTVSHVGGGIMQGREAQGNEIVDGSIPFIGVKGAPQLQAKDCRKCLQCNVHCPQGLDVQSIMDTKQGDAASCLQCGSCSYVCPAHINVCAKITAVKESISA
ncbi:MAG: hypothetical protein MI717_13260 [Spirochaetales bacterium]|nr:hypothetical protein [Spirochaetales bacterium]